MNGKYGNLSTTVGADRTRQDLRACFRKWGVNDFSVTHEERTKDGHQGARIEYYVNGQHQTLSCDRFWDYPTNLRALYLILDAIRLAAERGILEELARAAMAMLPEGRRRRPAHEVLQVQPNAPVEVAEASYRVLARQAHPDAGGSDEAMKELNEALEEFKAGRA